MAKQEKINEQETTAATEIMRHETVQDRVTNNMLEVFKRAGGLQISGVENIEKKDGSLIPSKEYTFINPIGKRATMKTFDKDIIESTEKIAMALYGQNVLTFAVCRELANVNKKEKLDSMGFKNIAEYANALFDLSRVTATQYARIGEYFIGDDYRIKSSVLPKGLQKGHMIELLSYVGEEGDISEIEELYMDGTLTDGMSTTAMRKALKDWKNGVNAIESTADEVPEIEDKEASKEDKEEKTDNKKSEKFASDTGEKENGFDLQKEVGKILSACNAISESFDIINRNEFSVAGYENALDTIRALANGMLG